MPINMEINPGELPSGFCPSGSNAWQQVSNAFAKTWAITFPLSLGNFSQGNTTPDPDMQGFPWYRLNADGSPDGWYTYFNGSWVRPHPIAANDVAAIRFHPGPYAAIATYDGGESGTVTPSSGPMWAVIGQQSDSSTDYGTMGGRMPVGVSADFAPGATGGATEHTLALNEMPAHSHTPGDGLHNFLSSQSGSGGAQNGSDAATTNQTSTVGGNPDGSTQPFSIMNPYIAGYWIARTGRIFYRV